MTGGLKSSEPVAWSGRAIAPSLATLVAAARKWRKMTSFPMKLSGLPQVNNVSPASQHTVRIHALAFLSATKSHVGDVSREGK